MSKFWVRTLDWLMIFVFVAFLLGGLYLGYPRCKPAKAACACGTGHECKCEKPCLCVVYAKGDPS